MRNITIDVRRASGTTGAFIDGVDLSQSLEEQTVKEIRQALNEHTVIFFRNQDITPDQHLRFAQRFGEIRVSRVLNSVPGHPQVAELRKEPESTHNHGGNWHTDQAFEETPPLGSILIARETPTAGGDTIFANMYAAYEGLSPGLKKTLEGLRAVHSAKKNKNEYESRQKVSARDPQRIPSNEVNQEASHPATPIHPESGRRVLFVNPSYTERFEGWTDEESASLLNHLYQQALRPENMYRFQWEVGSIAFWDNRSCWHFAVQDYNGSRRVMNRVSLKGGDFAPLN